MNEQNDKNIREALRRREARRPKPQPSADFCDKVMQQIEQPKRRHVWLYPAIGVAAAIALLFSVGTIPSNQDIEKPDLVAKTDTMKVKEHPVQKEKDTEVADTVNMVKEILQMSKPPRHYMAKLETQEENVPEPDLMDAYELAERAIAEEEQRIAMEMMNQMNSSIQTDFQEMTREIRQRGERMTQQVEIALSDDTY